MILLPGTSLATAARKVLSTPPEKARTADLKEDMILFRVSNLSMSSKIFPLIINEALRTSKVTPLFYHLHENNPRGKRGPSPLKFFDSNIEHLVPIPKPHFG